MGPALGVTTSASIQRRLLAVVTADCSLGQVLSFHTVSQAYEDQHGLC
jgi:hypothetical protein